MGHKLSELLERKLGEILEPKSVEKEEGPN